MKELQKSVVHWDIEDWEAIDDQKLPEGLGIQWSAQYIMPHVKQFLEKWDIDSVIVSQLQILTFDDYGVSGHANHISIFRALRDHKQQIKQSIWALESVSISRKYSGVIDAIASNLISKINKQVLKQVRNLAIVAHLAPLNAWRAMVIHHSQFVWYRKLFVIFSRYAYINTLFQV